MRPHTRMNQPLVETDRLLGAVQREGVLLHAGRAEIVDLAADGDNERIIGHAAFGGDFDAVRVHEPSQPYLAVFPIEADHFAGCIAKVVPMRLREIAEFVCSAKSMLPAAISCSRGWLC